MPRFLFLNKNNNPGNALKQIMDKFHRNRASTLEELHKHIEDQAQTIIAHNAMIEVHENEIKEHQKRVDTHVQAQADAAALHNLVGSWETVEPKA